MHKVITNLHGTVRKRQLLVPRSEISYHPNWVCSGFYVLSAAMAWTASLSM
jgi:hypothetical protein